MSSIPFNRRACLQATGAVSCEDMLPTRAWSETAAGSVGALRMARFPQKTDLILVTDRPPQLETPLHDCRRAPCSQSV